MFSGKNLAVSNKNILIGAVVTFVLYQLNTQKNWYVINNFQYALIFVAMILGISLYEAFVITSKNDNILDVSASQNLDGSSKVQEKIGDENGIQEVACYGTPFKVITSQYGDRALAAGYNEFVEPYQQGGINNPDPQDKIYIECMEEGGNIKANAEAKGLQIKKTG